MPRPVGDDPDPPVRLGHGLQQGGSDDVTINDIEYNSTQTHLTKMILCNALLKDQCTIAKTVFL